MAVKSSAFKLPTFLRLGSSPLYSSRPQGSPQHCKCGKPVSIQACREDSNSKQQGQEARGEHHCTLLDSSKVPCGGLAKAARYACNDAMFVSAAAQSLDERARSDLTLLAQEFSRLDMRARQDVALLGARAREDAEKLDTRARMKVQRLKHFAIGLKELAGTELKIAAAEHWNSGGLEADLRLVDLRARRRALEDSFATFQAVKNIHIQLAEVLQLRSKGASQIGEIYEANGFGSMEQDIEAYSAIDQVVIEDLHFNLSSVLADIEGVDFSDPDELKFIVAALLDMDEVDGASGASLVTECANSADVATRLALTDTLADAPSFWTLGNAGISALQRLAKDSNPDVASAACKALQELEDQWEKDQEILLFPQKSIEPYTASEDDTEDD